MRQSRLLMCIITGIVVFGSGSRNAAAQTSSPSDARPSTAITSRAATAHSKTAEPVKSSPVSISPTSLGPNSTSTSGSDDSLTFEGFDLKSLLARVSNMNPSRIDLPPSIDLAARYDVSVNLPKPATQAVMKTLILQAVEDRFHLVATLVKRATDVYVVSSLGDPPLASRATSPPDDLNTDANTVSSGSVSFRFVSTADGVPSSARAGIDDVDGIQIPGATMDEFCQILETDLDRPVVNETHLLGAFNFDLKSTSGAENDLLAQLRSKMKIAIQPSNRTIEIMVLQSR